MTIKKLTGRNFERVFWLVSIIALLILLNTCNGRSASTAKALTDSLRLAEKQARDSQTLHVFEYNNNMQVAIYRAKQAQDSAVSAWAKASALQVQIRALLGRKMPQATIDTGEFMARVREGVIQCCPLAEQLSDQVDVLRFADSLKDAACNEQITLSTNMVNAQGKLLDEARVRFNLLDSAYLEQEAAGKPRGSVWGGVETQVGPTSSAGVYLRYQTPRGKEYGIAGGRQQFGWYAGVKVGFKISLRKKH